MAQPTVRLLFLSVLLCAGLLLACERTIPLEERVQAYWEARKNRDAAAAYLLEDPRSGIDKTTYLQHMAGANIMYISIHIAGIQEDGDQAKVSLEMEYAVPGLPKNMKTRWVDVWYRVGRQWYHQMPFTKDERSTQP